MSNSYLDFSKESNIVDNYYEKYVTKSGLKYFENFKYIHNDEKLFGLKQYSLYIRLLLFPFGVICFILLIIADIFQILFKVLPVFLLRLNNTVKKNISITSLVTTNYRVIGNIIGISNDSLAHYFVYSHIIIYGYILYIYRLVFEGTIFNNTNENKFFSSTSQFLTQIGYLSARTQFFDMIIDNIISDSNIFTKQIVLLGAGMDTRFHRLNKNYFNYNNVNNDKFKFYEIDTNKSQKFKQDIILPRLFQIFMNDPNRNNLINKDFLHSTIKYISCNFDDNDNFLNLLQNDDFNIKIPSVFILEGVSYYLTQDKFFDILNKVSQCAPGTIIAFDVCKDYWNDSKLCDPSIKRFINLLKWIGEPFQYGMPSNSTPMKEYNLNNKFEVEVWLGGYTIQKIFLNITNDKYLLKNYHNSIMNFVILKVINNNNNNK